MSPPRGPRQAPDAASEPCRPASGRPQVVVVTVVTFAPGGSWNNESAGDDE
jgi:hypothetical protein